MDTTAEQIIRDLASSLYRTTGKRWLILQADPVPTEERFDLFSVVYAHQAQGFTLHTRHGYVAKNIVAAIGNTVAQAKSHLLYKTKQLFNLEKERKACC